MTCNALPAGGESAKGTEDEGRLFLINQDDTPRAHAITQNLEGLKSENQFRKAISTLELLGNP